MLIRKENGYRKFAGPLAQGVLDPAMFVCLLVSNDFTDLQGPPGAENNVPELVLEIVVHFLPLVVGA